MSLEKAKEVFGGGKEGFMMTVATVKIERSFDEAEDHMWRLMGVQWGLAPLKAFKESVPWSVVVKAPGNSVAALLAKDHGAQ